MIRTRTLVTAAVLATGLALTACGGTGTPTAAPPAAPAAITTTDAPAPTTDAPPVTTTDAPPATATTTDAPPAADTTNLPTPAPTAAPTPRSTIPAPPAAPVSPTTDTPSPVAPAPAPALEPTPLVNHPPAPAPAQPAPVNQPPAPAPATPVIHPPAPAPAPALAQPAPRPVALPVVQAPPPPPAPPAPPVDPRSNCQRALDLRPGWTGGALASGWQLSCVGRLSIPVGGFAQGATSAGRRVIEVLQNAPYQDAVYTWAHESGHAYDWSVMTPAARAYVVSQVGGDWPRGMTSSGPYLQQDQEAWGNAFAACEGWGSSTIGYKNIPCGVVTRAEATAQGR